MQILLVEDDVKLTKILKSFLEKQNYVCEVATSAALASEKLKKSGSYDAVIMDIVLGDGNGVDLCRSLRSAGNDTPILMLTSKSNTTDKITGLDAGADDYMPKPFSPEELQARLRALLRRPKSLVGEEIICGDIRLNILSHSVRRNGASIPLMPKEYSLLEYLMRKKNTVVKKEELLRHVWGIYSRTSSNRLEVYIRYLREKIDIPFDQKLIHTVRGLGYKVADD